jgi:hypothetical protein
VRIVPKIVKHPFLDIVFQNMFKKVQEEVVFPKNFE